MSPTESAWRALRATMNIRLPGDEEPEPSKAKPTKNGRKAWWE